MSQRRFGALLLREGREEEGGARLPCALRRTRHAVRHPRESKVTFVLRTLAVASSGP